MNTIEALSAIQSELKAPKGQFNSFGKYKYRSCEDILEAVKPLLKKYNSCLTISDQVVQVGDRYYIQATATFRAFDHLTGQPEISNSAYARESEKKSGMDESQITGTASSYARKYALNGLFLIDDTKDADTDEYKGADAVEDLRKTEKVRTEKISEVKIKAIQQAAANAEIPIESILKKFDLSDLSSMTEEQFLTCTAMIQKQEAIKAKKK